MEGVINTKIKRISIQEYSFTTIDAMERSNRRIAILGIPPYSCLRLQLLRSNHMLQTSAQRQIMIHWRKGHLSSTPN